MDSMVGVLGFDSRRGLGIFLFDIVSRTALEPTQLVRGALSLAVKQPGHEAGHLPLSSTEVKECMELYLHSHYVFMSLCLVKHRDNFAFTFSFFQINFVHWLTVYQMN